jgi:glycosyltransferase involved in cell wall biosynthesis
MRVAIATVQIPFVYGGAELMAANLRAALVAHGHEADIVALPFKWYPAEEIPKHVLMTRLADLSESNGRSIDRVIALKFPAYCVRHPRKTIWLLHQHRPAYEFWGTADCDLMRFPDGSRVRDFIHAVDKRFIAEARAVHGISREVVARLADFSNVDPSPLYPPPDRSDTFRCDDYGDYVFFPSRISPYKRQVLLIEAMARVRSPIRCVIAGGTTERDIAFQVEHRRNELGLVDRVVLTGEISHDEKIRYYAGALAVFFGPLREDYGFVTLEAFLSRKPVITCRDSGGPLEFVEDGVNGFVVDPDPAAIAEVLDQLYADRRRARVLGEAGIESYLAKRISWNAVIERLLA